MNKVVGKKMTMAKLIKRMEKRNIELMDTYHLTTQQNIMWA